MKGLQLIGFGLLVLVSHLINAGNDFVVTGVQMQPMHHIPQHVLSPRSLAVVKAHPSSSEVAVLQVRLSERAKEALQQHIDDALLHKTQSNTDLPSVVQLGMNGVPVFDQKTHGTCVMFAVTAAVDALLGKGDYISQVCQLVLNQYVANHTHSESSPWQGGIRLDELLIQMSRWGVMSKTQQMNRGCGGLTEYPPHHMSDLYQHEMSMDDFFVWSESVGLQGENGTWSVLLDEFQFVEDPFVTDYLIDKVKRALYEGDRLIIATMLTMNYGEAGAIGNYSNPTTKEVPSWPNTWVLTVKLKHMSRFFNLPAGHALVLTGYDDNAIATDDQGRTYKGLFTLRNSWGNQVGDQGDFYMSYDYFKAMVVNIVRLRNFK